MKPFVFILIIIFNIILFAKENPKKVSIQFMWHDQFEFAGFYVAKEKGFYKDLGLEVEFKKFTPDTNVTDVVVNGTATFGTSSISLIIDKANGKDIVLLGSVFQSSPLILLALKRDDLKTIEDIKNKKIMLTKDQQYFATLQAMLASKNVHLEDIQIKKHSFDVEDLISGKTDLMLAYTTNEPYILKEKGYEGKIFHPKDYGFDFYEELIFTSNSFAKENPKIVEDFYNATIKGWHYAFENIEEVSKLVFEKYNPQNKSLESLIYEAEEMKRLAYTKSGEIGTITKEKIRLIEYSYRILGELDSNLNIDDLLFFSNIKNKKLSLTNKEKAYLKEKSLIKVCIDPEWMPFEKNLDGEHIGMTSDYMKLLETQLSIPIKMVPTKSWSHSLEYGEKRECDIFSLLMSTPKRQKFLNFTKPYLEMPLVIATNLDTPFFDTIDYVKGKKIGIVKGYAYAELLKVKYPELNIVDIDNIKEGLKKLQEGELFGILDTIATLGYHIQKDYLAQLKISGKLNESWDLTIGTRNDEPLLNSVFNKALDTITFEEKQNILNKWITVKVQKPIDYTSFYKQLFLLLLIIFVLGIIYRQYILNRANKELHKKVKEEIDKSNQQHNIITQQTKKVAMGEMLQNIAHQWRQPLSVISVAATGIKLKKEYGELTDKELLESIESINNSAQFLSKTIDDFRNFYSEEKNKKKFNCKKTIKKAFELFGVTFNANNITIVDKLEDIEINSIENELIQVLINIFNNAKDALEHTSEDKLIFINSYKKENTLMIEIIDNAGGIREDIIDKVFEPYFTTKHKSQGTGIGLYISDEIVSKHLDGEIKVSNKEFTYKDKKFKGAHFCISLPI